MALAGIKNVGPTLRAVSTEPPESLLHKLGRFALLAYLFVLISRVLDVTFPQLRAPMVLYVIMAAIAFLTGITQPFRLRVNWWFGLYLLWMGLAVPTSHWRGGSTNHWLNALKIFLFFICIQVLITTWKKLRSAIWVLALGLLTAAILGRVMGDSSTGRLKLEVGTLADPNDFAMYMIMALCLWLLLWQTTRNPVMTSPLYLPPILLILAAFMSTGSRGGLIALLTVFGVWMMHISMKGKLILTATLCLLLPMAPFVMSDYVKSRFLTISSVDQDDAVDVQTANRLGSSVASTESRKELFLQSLAITVAHPIFGIGPGMFPVYSDFLAKQAGRSRGEWQPTHNLYTQISSECGVPALVLYLLGVMEVIMMLRRVRRSKEPIAEAESMRQAAGYLLMALYGLLAAGLFLSIAYTTAIYVIAALSIVLGSVHATQAARFRAAAATPTPAIPPSSVRRSNALPSRQVPLSVPRLGVRG